MKLILKILLLFAVGFFGTGLVLHPESPLNIDKLLSAKAADKEEEASKTIEEDETDKEPDIGVTEGNQSGNTGSGGDGSGSNKPQSTTKADKDRIDDPVIVTTRPANTEKVTKRPADLSKPIEFTKDFIMVKKDNLLAFLADKQPNIVIVGPFGKSADKDLIDSLNLLTEEFPISAKIYVIDTESSDLPIQRGAIVLDENLSMSTQPAIYYQKEALVYYHKSLKSVEYNDLHNFFLNIH